MRGYRANGIDEETGRPTSDRSIQVSGKIRKGRRVVRITIISDDAGHVLRTIVLSAGQAMGLADAIREMLGST